MRREEARPVAIALLVITGLSLVSADEIERRRSAVRMDLRPVEAITAISGVNVKRATDDVAPPFAIDGSVPMGDDSCEDADLDQGPGVEEDNSEDGNVEEPGLPDRATEDPPKIVDLFA